MAVVSQEVGNCTPTLVEALKCLIRNTCLPSLPESHHVEALHFHPEIQSKVSEIITFQNIQPLH